MLKDTDSNVTQFPIKHIGKPSLTRNNTTGSAATCQHPRFIVDESKAEVECAVCHQMMNPVWVLARLADRERNTFRRWARMTAELRLMGQRFRVKCRHCNQMTPIQPNVAEYEVTALADKIEKEELSRQE